ncbi:uncharacterized protein [Anabrus simplex]|uniref:uncharacterized protein isoform X2 n=1 Tax=Anabrus simplex TaxID=316456 RepID=UPI0035A28105
MKEDTTSVTVPNNSIVGNLTTTVNQDILRKYSFGRRIPRSAIPYNNKRLSQLKLSQESRKARSNNVQGQSELSGEVLDMPPKTDTVITEASQIQSCKKQATEAENEMMKNISRPTSKADTMSEAAILRSVLRPQGVPVPPDKVGIVREPQVIVRKFNIPVFCSNNSGAKFTKLKERWKYQHDVVGMTNVNPNNPLHAILKSKPVVSYSVASFVNESNLPNAMKSTGILTSVGKMSTSAILPKNHTVNPNWLPSASSSSNISVLPSSLPSTPTAVVKPVQVNPSQLSSANSVDSGKFVILKSMDDGEKTSLITSERDCEIIDTEVASVNQIAAQSLAITSPKISKPRTIIVQGTHLSALKKENEPQNGTRYLNPFADMKDKLPIPESIQAMDSSEVVDLGAPSPEGIESDANTLHLEILSGGSLSETGDVEMADPSASVNEENLIRIAALKESETNVINNIGQARSVTISHNDNNYNSKPLTFITVPASGNGSVSQLLLKPQPAPITVQTATPAPRLVSAGTGDQVTKTSIVTALQQPDGPLLAKTIQLTPVALTNSVNGLQQKPVMSDKALLGQDVVLLKNEQKIKNEVLVLKSLQPQTISLTPTKLPAPVIVTGKNEGSLPLKMKNDVVVLKPVQLQNGSVPAVGVGDQLKSNNLALLTTRQSIAMQYQRDMMRAQEEIHVPRCISYPAHKVEVVDSSTQTSLFSLLEQGRLVEMTFSADGKGAKVGPTVAMPSSTVQLTNSTSVGKPATSMNTLPPGKRVVSVESGGRAVTIGASPSPSEPLCKKLKLEQTESNPGNIFRLLRSPNKVKLPSTDSSACQNINKQTLKNINDLMVCDNIIQQHNAAIDMGSVDLMKSSSKLELEGVEAMVVDPSDILPNNHLNNKPKVPSINKKFVLQSAYKDWTNCLVPDEDGNVPLHNAVLDEDLNQVKRQCFVLAARKESVDIRNAEKQTPLHLAVWLGCPQIVHTLLKFSAQPGFVDFKGNNALHLAIEKTSNFACLQILLNEYNCKEFINNLNHDGFSPLHLCAINGKCEESVALIKKGANINLRHYGIQCR